MIVYEKRSTLWSNSQDAQRLLLRGRGIAVLWVLKRNENNHGRQGSPRHQTSVLLVTFLLSCMARPQSSRYTEAVTTEEETHTRSNRPSLKPRVVSPGQYKGQHLKCARSTKHFLRWDQHTGCSLPGMSVSNNVSVCLLVFLAKGNMTWGLLFLSRSGRHWTNSEDLDVRGQADRPGRWGVGPKHCFKFREILNNLTGPNFQGSSGNTGLSRLHVRPWVPRV